MDEELLIFLGFEQADEGQELSVVSIEEEDDYGYEE